MLGAYLRQRAGCPTHQISRPNHNSGCPILYALYAARVGNHKYQSCFAFLSVNPFIDLPAAPPLAHLLRQGWETTTPAPHLFASWWISLKGTGFSPYIKSCNISGLLAPEGRPFFKTDPLPFASSLRAINPNPFIIVIGSRCENRRGCQINPPNPQTLSSRKPRQ